MQIMGGRRRVVKSQTRANQQQSPDIIRRYYKPEKRNITIKVCGKIQALDSNSGDGRNESQQQNSLSLAGGDCSWQHFTTQSGLEWPITTAKPRLAQFLSAWHTHTTREIKLSTRFSQNSVAWMRCAENPFDGLDCTQVTGLHWFGSRSTGSGESPHGMQASVRSKVGPLLWSSPSAP